MAKRHSLVLMTIINWILFPFGVWAQTCHTPVGGDAVEYQICELDLPEGYNSAEAIGLTSDGTTIVGSVRNGESPTAMIWSSEAGFTILPSLSGSEGWFREELGVNGIARGISDDARVVVGVSNLRATIWLAGKNGQNLGLIRPGSFSSDIADVSADGQFLVGGTIYERSRDFTSDAFIWADASGFRTLGRLPGHTRADAHGISADGVYVVGESEDPDTGSRAFRWSSTNGLEGLNDPDGTYESAANAASGDGSIIVGWNRVEGGLTGAIRAFRWTEADGWEQLGFLPGNDHPVSNAVAISDDGSTIVGIANTATTTAGFVWTEESGMRNLGTLPGGGAVHVSAVSGDGSVIVGRVGDANTSEEWRAVYWIRTDGE
jgi:probable HAF family extracellular repeat protein